MTVEEEEERARELAEARRRRILESSKDRMGFVTGTVPKPKTAAAAAGTTNDEIAENVEGGGGGGDATEAETPASEAATPPDEAKAPEGGGETTTTTKAGGAARLAALRKRRFKKTPAAASEPSDAHQEKGQETNETTTTSSAAMTPTTENKDSTTTATVESATATTTTTTEVDAPQEEEDGKPKIKYQGVAKMRRRMLKEKQQQDQATVETLEHKAAVRAKIAVAKRPPRSTLDMLAIFFHVFTVLLMFGAGFDLGLQQADLSPVGTVVHKGLAPRTEGLRFFALLGFATPTVKTFTVGTDGSMLEEDTKNRPPQLLKKGNLEKELGLDRGEASPMAVNLDEDEFANVKTVNKPKRKNSKEEFGDEKPSDDFDSQQQQRRIVQDPNNLDPLFGVDLDALTEGPGLYFWVARVAVGAHRVNLALFYYGPRQFVETCLSFLTSTPPVLFLLALFIRHVLIKTIRGRNGDAFVLPHQKKNQSSADGDKEQQDILSMGKKFLKNMIVKGFPMATSLYENFILLTQDMYVLICGMLVGVTWVHYARLEPDEANQSGKLPIVDQAEHAEL